MIRAARRVSSDEASHSHQRACFWYREEDGSLGLKGRLPAEEGAALVEAIEAARSAPPARRRYPRPANHECLADLASGRSPAAPVATRPATPIR